MRKHIVALVAVLAVLSVCTSVFAAGARGLPNRYLPRSIDGPIRMIDLPDSGTTVATWAYRNGAEYDIAISTSGANGEWSDPIFLGHNDGRDQVEPVLAADANGNLYVAFTDRGEDRVMMAYRPADRTDWTHPWAITPQGVGAETPGVLVVGDRLIVAVKIGRAIQMIDMPVFSSGSTARTINDSPDPIGRDDDDPPPPDDTDPGSPDYSPKTGKAFHPSR
jgi:hypothetical protein